MTPDEARSRFCEIVEKEGKELVAAKLGCSVNQVINIKKGPNDGGQDPGMRVGAAIESVYEIPMKSWVEAPAYKVAKPPETPAPRVPVKAKRTA